LVHLNRTLALASDFTQVHHALALALPTFTANRGFSVLICYDGCWDVLVRDPGHPRQQGVLEQLAERILMSAATAGDTTVRTNGLLGVPLAVGLHPMGILLVTDSPILDSNACRALEAVAAPISIAIRNVYTLFNTRDQALRDGLTGCFNHAHAIERLEGELRRARRSRTPLSLIMFDLDGFKGINDGYGHLAGDRLLAEVGRRLAEIARSTDVKCRYGGDEFLLLLPDTPLDGARQLAESIRRAIADLRIQSGEISLSATASLGVITVQDGECDPPTVLARVDGALYRSKRERRNRVSAGETELAGL
jgi:diguanylate cyclase (GGDEF)-like protein